MFSWMLKRLLRMFGGTAPNFAVEALEFQDPGRRLTFSEETRPTLTYVEPGRRFTYQERDRRS